MRVAEVQTVPKLKRLLDGAEIERALPILRRINDLLRVITQKCSWILPFAASTKGKMRTRLRLSIGL